MRLPQDAQNLDAGASSDLGSSGRERRPNVDDTAAPLWLSASGPAATRCAPAGGRLPFSAATALRRPRIGPLCADEKKFKTREADPTAERWTHMADIPTLVLSATYDELREEVVFTLVRCEPDPLAAGQAPALAALLPRIDAEAATENQLDLAVQRAEARAVFLDGGLDDTVDGVVNALRTLTGNDRTAPLYITFLGNQQPNELKAPILGEELDTLETRWLPELTKSSFPTLSAFAPILQQQVAGARLAVTALAVAQQDLAHHRSALGGKGQLVEEINAARKAAHGNLGAIAHANPQAMLPSGYANGFFAAGRTGRKLTTAELEEREASTKKLLASLQEKLVTSKAEDAAREAKREQRKNAKTQRALERANRAAEKANARVAKLQAEIAPEGGKAGTGGSGTGGSGTG
jgi:hypothetical protein